jgi:hypothetical protein
MAASELLLIWMPDLVAYENGQSMFSWSISSGIEPAPTSPGVFQILSHEPVAYGSSYLMW